MKKEKVLSRREMLACMARAFAGAVIAGMVAPVKVLAEKTGIAAKLKLERAGAPLEYNPFEHSFRIAIDADLCIGCGQCVEACKTENKVIREPFYFRTWVERYIIKRAPEGSTEIRGETLVDSPGGGIAGFPKTDIPKKDIVRSFFVPKLCNQCEHSPCSQSCPVGATFSSPEGVVLIDPNYCIGCGFCIQACPYGCRYMSPVSRTADKCTLCYHRVTRGLRPACVEVCPTHARIFGDMHNAPENDSLKTFYQTKKLQILKPNLRTGPRVMYSGLDKEVI